MVKHHFMAKRKLTNQTAQFSVLVFSSMLTSVSATSIAKELTMKTSLVCDC